MYHYKPVVPTPPEKKKQHEADIQHGRDRVLTLAVALLAAGFVGAAESFPGEAPVTASAPEWAAASARACSCFKLRRGTLHAAMSFAYMLSPPLLIFLGKKRKEKEEKRKAYAGRRHDRASGTEAARGNLSYLGCMRRGVPRQRQVHVNTEIAARSGSMAILLEAGVTALQWVLYAQQVAHRLGSRPGPIYFPD